MKSSNKSSILTGTILLALAALFSICLLLQPLDFGIGGPGHNNVFYYIGNMLSVVYGFSSILIPVFLFIAGISCFASKWTAKKTMRLITALIPFFTCVFTEKICRSVLGQGDAGVIKAIITGITGLMLVIIEIAGAGIIADSVNEKVFYKGQKAPKYSEYNYEEYVSPKAEKAESVGVKAPVYKADEDVSDSENEDRDDTDFADEDGDFKYEKISAKKSIFDKALEKLASHKKDESFEDLAKEAQEVYEADIPKIEDYENIDKKNEELSQELAADNYQDAATDSTDTASTDEDFDEEPKNPASIISQEEYAALLSEPEAEAEAPDAAVEELEWPDLPPVPAELPADYIEDIDENDPALKFPPEEDEDFVEASDIPGIPDDFAETELSITPDFDQQYEAEQPQPAESTDFIEETTEVPTENPVEPAAQIDIPAFEQPEFAPATEQTDLQDENNPYAAARYIDSVVPNPNYPVGISIREEKYEPPVVKQPEPMTPVAPKYPRHINFGDIDAIQPENTNSANTSDDFQPEFDTDFQSDFEEISVDDISAEEKGPIDYEAQFITTDNIMSEKAPVHTNTVDPDFFDIDMNNQPEDEELSDDIKPVKKEMETTNSVFNQISNTEKNISLGKMAGDVFSEMEADILANGDFDIAEPEMEEPVEENEVEEYPQESLEPDTESDVLNPNAGHANNLTADELTDFFNAQQAENTPKTKLIEGEAPRSHHATKKGPYVIPSNILTAYKDDQYWIIDDETKQASVNLKQTLAEFNIDADIIGIKKGPVVTMFELLPAPGVKLSKIVALQDNIALSLAAQSVRIVAPIPGKQAVGIEVPNKHRSVVGFREIIEMDLPEWNKMAVPVILGKDILGKAQLIDLVKTPHMLIAGATGSGKSVCVNSLILSILYKRSFKDVKLILVDPKVVELKLYNNIPHLLTPVITEPKKALQALQYCLCEMERRYALLDGLGVRDISSYNERIKERDICTEKLPYIVVIIDEFADLMATSGKELESIVARLTAMSRAVGIHLVLATQRPSVNVITGLIKANIPSRIAFMVASRTDSNIIIDSVGAEKLLGRGDMLYASAVDPAPIRIQGTYVNDNEVEDVVNYVKQYGEPDYIDDEIFVDDDDDVGGNVDLFGNNMDEDPLYDQALEIVVQAGKASASYIQRRLKIGYNRAARLVEEMEERGIVGPANGSKPREVIHIP